MRLQITCHDDISCAYGGFTCDTGDDSTDCDFVPGELLSANADGTEFYATVLIALQEEGADTEFSIKAFDSAGNESSNTLSGITGPHADCEADGCPMAAGSGDVNFDNTVNILDVVSVVQYVLSNIDYDSCQVDAADMNGDQTINILDIVEIVQLILGD